MNEVLQNKYRPDRCRQALAHPGSTLRDRFAGIRMRWAMGETVSNLEAHTVLIWNTETGKAPMLSFSMPGSSSWMNKRQGECHGSSFLRDARHSDYLCTPSRFWKDCPLVVLYWNTVRPEGHDQSHTQQVQCYGSLDGLLRFRFLKHGPSDRHKRT